MPVYLYPAFSFTMRHALIIYISIEQAGEIRKEQNFNKSAHEYSEREIFSSEYCADINPMKPIIKKP